MFVNVRVSLILLFLFYGLLRPIKVKNEFFYKKCKIEQFTTFGTISLRRGRVVRAPDWKSGGNGFKSRSDNLAGVVSW